MSNSWFRFKHFMVNQDDCAMKVGTDGVLLGAWADIPEGCRLLDIGTGTGVMALMATQRGAGSVVAIEIDGAAAAQATRNVAQSEWADRIVVINCDVAEFHPDEKFDRILSNPPFFRDSLRSPDSVRNAARHNDSLSYETLVRCSADMLAPDGQLCVVLPFGSVEDFVKCASSEDLCLVRRTDVMTVPGRDPKRSLLSFATVHVQPITSVLSIYDAVGNESAEYIELVKDFYLRY